MEKKSDAFKHMLVYLGVLLILVGATAGRAENLPFFFVGLILLALQTFEFKNVQVKKLAIAEIVLSAALSIAAITQLSMARGFNAPQVFLVILLLGAILIIVESVRKLLE